MENKVYLMGHGNLSMLEFLAKLKSKEIATLIDVRSVPYSKYVSHFNKENLKQELEKGGIQYVFKGDVLGGRPPGGIEAYVNSEAFENNILALVPVLTSNKCAIMCSEVDHEKCHRRFIGMKLKDKGFSVSNIGKKLMVMEQKTLGGFK